MMWASKIKGVTRTPLYQSVHEIFEVPSFTNYKDQNMIGRKIKTRSSATAEGPRDALC